MQKRVWKTLCFVAERIGQLQAGLLFTLFYLVLLAPVAIVFRWFADPLHLRRWQPFRWHSKPQSSSRSSAHSWDWARAQF